MIARGFGGLPSVPRAPIAILVLAAVAVVAHFCAGCGASALRTHATAATIATVATQGAARIVEDEAVADVARTCLTAEEACVVAVKERWAPADVAVASTRAALIAWTETLAVAERAGDDQSLWQPLGLAAARLVLAWERLAAALREMHVDIPPLPEPVLVLARAIGGAP